MNHYHEHLTQLAEDLINTYDSFLDEPEHLCTSRDLKKFLQDHNIDHDVDEQALPAVHKLRETLRVAWTGNDLATITQILNPLLADARIQPQLKTDEQDPNVCYMYYQVDSQVSLLEYLAFEAALGISLALQAHGIERLRACEADPCRDVFVDMSRNGSRRFCSNRCSNRYNVQAFRSRQQNDAKD